MTDVLKPGADLRGPLGPDSRNFNCKIFWSPIFALLQYFSSYINQKCLFCVCVLLKYNLKILVLRGNHHIHPPLGRYAQSRIWAPLLKKLWIRP